jgi:5-methylcytosine-specific restriction protein A
VEGSVQRVLANRYERNVRARAACIQHFGAQCSVCDLRFVDRYGEVGTDFIEVHHKRPLATLGKQYHLDPIMDLVPVCPNCHAMLHRRDPPYDVEQLRFIVQSA